jgi:hypothetical protein
MGIAFSRTTHAPFSGRKKLFRLYTFKDEKKTKKTFFRPKNYFSSEKITFPKKCSFVDEIYGRKKFFWTKRNTLGRKSFFVQKNYFSSKKIFFPKKSCFVDEIYGRKNFFWTKRTTLGRKIFFVQKIIFRLKKFFFVKKVGENFRRKKGPLSSRKS